MTWGQVKRLIERSSFSARLNLASGRTLFFRLLSDSYEVAALVRLLRADPRAQGNVLERLRQLAEASFDHRYENPHDTALAGYLAALQQTDLRAAGMAAEIVLGARQIWWAREVAQSILEMPAERGSAVQEREWHSLLMGGTGLVGVPFYGADTDTSAILGRLVGGASFRWPSGRVVLVVHSPAASSSDPVMWGDPWRRRPGVLIRQDSGTREYRLGEL